MSESPVPVPVTPTVEQEIAELRSLVVALGVILLVVAVSFGGFAWKQGRQVLAVSTARQEQVARGESHVKQLALVGNALALHAQGQPELLAIFEKYGVKLNLPDPTVPPP